jgi:hypothetical protein
MKWSPVVLRGVSSLTRLSKKSISEKPGFVNKGVTASELLKFGVFRQSQHRRAGDGFQRPLRSRFQPRLTPSVIATRGREFYCWTQQEAVIQSWCGVTCARTGASLATVGSQALGKRTESEWRTQCTSGNDRYGQGNRSLGGRHRDEREARATIRPHSQHGTVGRSVSFNGEPTHPQTHPVDSAVLTSSVWTTCGT